MNDKFHIMIDAMDILRDLIDFIIPWVLLTAILSIIIVNIKRHDRLWKRVAIQNGGLIKTADSHHIILKGLLSRVLLYQLFFIEMSHQ